MFPCRHTICRICKSGMFEHVIESARRTRHPYHRVKFPMYNDDCEDEPFLLRLHLSFDCSSQHLK